MRERAHLDVHADEAAQAGRERRDADVPVSRVRDHDDVRGQPVVVLAQQLGEGPGSDLLLALDEEPHGDRQVIAQGTQRTDVHRDPRLVVGRAAAVEALAADNGLERRAVPVGGIVLRLDVVMRVKQHNRSALRSLPLTDHGRRGTVVGPDDLRRDALSGQELGRLPRGLLHLCQALRVSADGLDPDQSLKVAYQARQLIMHTVLKLAHGGNSTTPRSWVSGRHRCRR